MPGHRWRSAAAGWLRSAADSLSPVHEVSAPDPGPYDGRHPSAGAAPAAVPARSRSFDVAGAPEHWLKLLRDAGLAPGEPGATESRPARPAVGEAVSPVQAHRLSDSSPAKTRETWRRFLGRHSGKSAPSSPPAAEGGVSSWRATQGAFRPGDGGVAATAGPATGSGQAVPEDGGGRRIRAAADRRIPQLLIGRRAAVPQTDVQRTTGQRTIDQKTTDRKTIDQQTPDLQTTRAGSTGTPARTFRSRTQSPRPAAPPPPSNTYRPESEHLPGTLPMRPMPAASPGLPGLPGLPGRSHPAATRPPADRTVRYAGDAAAVGLLPSAHPAPNDPSPPPTQTPERIAMQYPVPGPEQPAGNPSPALAGEWPDLPHPPAAPATDSAPERAEHALTRNFRLRDEQRAL